MRQVTAQWAEQDLVRTAGWLERLSPGASRDAAVSTFTQRASQTDPEGAAVWASTITDVNTRNNDLERIARQWLRVDKNAATTWINQSSALNADVKKRLLTPPATSGTSGTITITGSNAVIR
jgi:hypothetical protein